MRTLLFALLLLFRLTRLEQLTLLTVPAPFNSSHTGNYPGPEDYDSPAFDPDNMDVQALLRSNVNHNHADGQSQPSVAPPITTNTPPWSVATDKLMFLKWDQAVVEERKRDLNADQGYPRGSTSVNSGLIAPRVAVTSHLRHFCEEEECWDEEIEEAGLYHGILPGNNMIDGNLATLCALLGNNETPTWAEIVLPGSHFVDHVTLHVTSLHGEEQINQDLLLNQMLVSLEWFDIRKDCEPVQVVENTNMTVMTSTCEGGVASRVILQVSRYHKDSVPLNLTLAEVEVYGNTTNYPRHSLKSSPASLNNTVLNMYFRLGVTSGWADNERIQQPTEKRTAMEHTVFMETQKGLHRISFKYIDGWVTSQLKDCGELERLNHYEVDKLPCIANKNLAPCDWTIVFLEDIIHVYIETSLAAVFRRDTGYCSPDQCYESCQKKFVECERVYYDGNSFAIDASELQKTLKKPKKPTTKKDRHDKCYEKERLLAMNCDFMLIDVPILNKTKPMSLVHGWELLDISEQLEEEFMEGQAETIVQYLVDGILNEILEDHFGSEEFEREVEDVFQADMQLSGMLEVIDMLMQLQLDIHFETFNALAEEQIEVQMFETERFGREFMVKFDEVVNFRGYVDEHFSLITETTNQLFDTDRVPWKSRGTPASNMQFKEPPGAKNTTSTNSTSERINFANFYETKGSVDLDLMVDIIELGQEFIFRNGNAKIRQDFRHRQKDNGVTDPIQIIFPESFPEPLFEEPIDGPSLRDDGGSFNRW